ncbi:TetR/AcrR family transcriptional regulator [Streptomyces sp. NBC_00237]|uniref:TetR/AcrR family transcriptional regulator n=1 Tax=Streptomyces sp. NBC_00237 TaxID=2975687 RepID=UPI002250B895|nr:TetR/AcrR family transcriptional regulator [Streptomyces sp. NBC_00237]MCX5205942.1 TetR/AcrR family transcriptional regulator [Streptomyces sp. NBC_00237]
MSPKLTGGATLAEHKAATREAMIDAFAALLHEAGWQDLKLQDVARQAGVARTAVYNYFPDKTALLLAWSQREMARFMTLAERELAARTDPVDRLQILIKLVLTEFSFQRGAGASVAPLLPPGDRAAFFEHVAPLAALVGGLLDDATASSSGRTRR